MSKKLEKAIALKQIVVKNVINGEIHLLIKGRSHILAPGQQLDIGSMLDNPRDAGNIPGLKSLLKRGNLILQ